MNFGAVKVYLNADAGSEEIVRQGSGEAMTYENTGEASKRKSTGRHRS